MAKQQSYDQPIKELSRKVIWEHSINALTIKRNESCICSPSLLDEFSLFAAKKLSDQLHNDLILNQVHANKQWLNFHDQTYRAKSSEELKIAYFCGPEPLKDLEHLLARGVIPENIWAFEIYEGYYESIVSQIKKSGIYINLYQGNIKDFIKAYPQKFDIVYLDFTNHLFSKKHNPALLVNDVVEAGFLSDLSCLIVNTCFPDNNDTSTIAGLGSYFHNRPWIPNYLIEDSERRYYSESFECHSILSNDDIRDRIKNNFRNAYSDYASAFPDVYCNILDPLQKILKLPAIRKRLFKEQEIQSFLKQLEDTENYFLQTDIPDWYFVKGLIDENVKPFSTFFKEKLNLPKSNANRFDAIKFYYLMVHVIEGHYDVFSEELLNVTSEMQGRTIEEYLGIQYCLFCDIPNQQLWYNLILGKYGHPHHINYRNHKRFSYTAKEREMCLDIFTLDKCRSLYDWLPSFEFMPDKFSQYNNQLIIRSYMDLIFKSQFYINQSFYFWGHLLAQSDTEHSKIIMIPERKILSI